jgi:hypothetical protein
MPKISDAGGPSYEGVIPEHDADLRDDGPRVDVQEPIRPQEDPSLGGQFHAGRNAVEQPAANEDEQDRYADWSKADLVGECERRGLPKSGTVPELTARLQADDQPVAQLADDEDTED